MNKKKRELSQNELVESIESNYEKIKPYISKIVMFSTIAIVGILAIVFYRYTQRSANESAWREYLSSTRFNDSRGYDFVAENFAGTTPGELALLSAGDADYGNAMTQIIQNRSEYTAKLTKAADRFKQIVEGTSNSSPEVKLRATYSLAYAYEGLGKFADAKKLYQDILDNAPDTPESELAEKGLKRVSNPELTSIYAAFQEWQPPSTAPDAPGTGMSLPERPVLDWSSPVADGAESGESNESTEVTGEDSGEGESAPAVTPENGESGSGETEEPASGASEGETGEGEGESSGESEEGEGGGN